MRILIGQLNSTVGDFEGNFKKISDLLASADEADLVIFPECALCGYPQQDLLDYKAFASIAENFFKRLLKKHPQSNFILGSVEANKESGRPLRNVAYVVLNGKLVHKYFKRLLPSYDVFDEDRFFEPGRKPLIFNYKKTKIALTICEDIWADSKDTQLHNRYQQNPVKDSSRADLLINISASPFEARKVLSKQKMLAGISKRHRISLLYVNAVGANDSIIFDGRSYFFDEKGKARFMGKRFEEDSSLIDLENLGSATTAHDEIADIYDAIKVGIADYCKKTGFTSVVLGVSGGIDSAVVACLAVDALGAENVVGVLMPSRFTSRESNEDALGLARVMQNPIHLLPIEFMFSAAIQSLGKAFEGTDSGTAEENLQSRIRGTLLMGLSNKFGHLLLTTGNKSELAVGYCTLYGDMNGGLAPISDVYKTQVYELGREANRRWNRIPERIFTKPPTAELREGQTDQDTLPEYARLDEMLELILERHASKSELLKKKFEASIVEKVFRWISANEFKRYQMPLGLKITSKAFGIGRRIPIVHKFFSQS